MKPNYLVIPLLAVVALIFGSQFTNAGMDWYHTIQLPSWTPPGAVIGAIWTTIFFLTTISALMVWNRMPRDRRFSWTVALFALNAALNALWSYVFFVRHWMGVAIFEALALEVTVLLLIALVWHRSRIAASLLLPYAAWVLVASYLTYSVWLLNT